jgi:hypothetical protein
MFPTQGGYEESANPTISSVRVLAASFTARPALVPHHNLQAFAYHYRDHRDVRARPDNIVAPRPVNVSIATIGGSSVGLFRAAAGEIDSIAWVAAQTGDWYGQEHRAFSAALEAGYRLPQARWRPWLRGGWLRASGDADARDDRHDTFFQMLPSNDRYVASTAYALMNVNDLFAQIEVQPHDRMTARAEVHRVSLADAADRWYYGSGATSRTGTFFGFSGRPSNGATALGTIAEGKVDVRLAPAWSVSASLAFMKGGEVVHRLFLGDRLAFLSFESVLSF